jgi:hypothetical protein
MYNKKENISWKDTQAFKDLVIILTIASIVYVLAAVFDFFDKFAEAKEF